VISISLVKALDIKERFDSMITKKRAQKALLKDLELKEFS